MRRSLYDVEIDGTNISTALAPILISISIKRDDKANSDELVVELDDSDGQIELPRMGATVTAALGWDDTGAVVMFEGTVDTASSNGKGSKHGGGHHGGGGGKEHSAGGRSKGRTLTISAKSADMTTTLKARRSAHMDDANFGDVAQAFGKKAGLTVKVDSDVASVHRKWWGMSNESFTTWATRHAEQIGATFAVQGTDAAFISRAGGSSVSGKTLPAVDVAWGLNLLEWSIDPVLSRPDYGTFGTRWYDPKVAAHKVEMADGSAGKSPAKHTHPFKAPTQDHAKGQSGANKGESAREKGAGSVTIDGNPDAQPAALANGSGIRDGVDGTYLISGVTHSLNRHSGFITHLELKQPAGAAGTDSRAGSAKAA